VGGSRARPPRLAKNGQLCWVCAVWLTACLRVAWSCAVPCVRCCSLGKWRGMPSALAHGGAGWSSSACARWWRRRGALVLAGAAAALGLWLCSMHRGLWQGPSPGCMLSSAKAPWSYISVCLWPAAACLVLLLLLAFSGQQHPMRGTRIYAIRYSTWQWQAPSRSIISFRRR